MTDITQLQAEYIQELESLRDHLAQQLAGLPAIVSVDSEAVRVQTAIRMDLEKQVANLEDQVMHLTNRAASTRDNVVRLKDRLRAVRVERAELRQKLQQATAQAELDRKLNDARHEGFVAATTFFMDRASQVVVKEPVVEPVAKAVLRYLNQKQRAQHPGFVDG